MMKKLIWLRILLIFPSVHVLLVYLLGHHSLYAQGVLLLLGGYICMLMLALECALVGSALLWQVNEVSRTEEPGH